jgi:hypothetical protein
MTAKIILILLAWISINQLAHADPPDEGKPKSVGSLLRQCEDGETGDAMQLLICTTYIRGIGEVMAANALTLKGMPARPLEAVCLGSDGATYGAFDQAFKNWAHKHPEKWELQAVWGVIIALREAWPCPGK